MRTFFFFLVIALFVLLSIPFVKYIIEHRQSVLAARLEKWHSDEEKRAKKAISKIKGK